MSYGGDGAVRARRHGSERGVPIRTELLDDRHQREERPDEHDDGEGVGALPDAARVAAVAPDVEEPTRVDILNVDTVAPGVVRGGGVRRRGQPIRVGLA